MSTREVKIPGPDHPITIRPAGTRVVARVGDEVIAETDAALALQEASYPEVLYVPLADVRPEVLRPSGTSTHCPYKGDASYYDLLAGGRELNDAVWFYREPYDAVAALAGHVAFYPDRVDVAAEA
jgi:uncharacterized protein (DUF427 family)